VRRTAAHTARGPFGAPAAFILSFAAVLASLAWAESCGDG